MNRRERPAKPALTRPGIIATAVAILRAEGLDKVTMRRLAQELDTGPASLYVYVRNTAELHAAVLDELLGAVDLRPVTAAGDWRQRLIDVLTSYAMVLFDNPGLAQSALVARPSGANYLALADGVLGLLRDGGVADGQAAWGLDLLLQFATATAAEHSVQDAAIGAEDDWDALRAALKATPLPNITALGPDLVSGTGIQRLTWGFHVLIEGIRHTPLPR